MVKVLKEVICIRSKTSRQELDEHHVLFFGEAIIPKLRKSF
ncbi:putative uncharacterized protein [Parachlamydia acanthamoebae UV-7]|uniref:Uncharacterized protein n=2 Tax=Parachlamydia acanthamoebae TaxID=83552 RepID=F8L0N1_PARAV|nr:hypothetical protein pah_c015o001 [Parachlamydia acanthamoebae str. Hall's coccus]KIA77474.1 hypothetical protein DB43_GF00160 [Parachlamydia acanthamoebae]CCB86781.1 putative uncharacterized protein [Parachlamydia acanthamoebae UV-7]